MIAQNFSQRNRDRLEEFLNMDEVRRRLLVAVEEKEFP